MIRQVIIIGGHIQALGLVRQVHSLGMPVILFIEDAYSVARFSRAVSRSVVFGSVNDLGEYLIPYQDTDTLLFPTADPYVEYLEEHREALSAHFILGIPQTENVRLFSDKRYTYQFASAKGIPHPRSWYPERLEDVESIIREVSFPLVIKPAVMYSFHRQFGKKAFRCNDGEELMSRCKTILEKMPLSSLIIQEFLPGGASSLYSYGVFALEGEPKAWITANRIRQNPMDFGNSTTFAVTCRLPELEETARRILQETHYTGLAEVEFMYDATAGCYKFLEINTRAWKWHSLSTGLGFGFLSEMIRYGNHQAGDFREPDSNQRMAWVERLTDLSVIVRESLKGRMNPWKAWGTYRQPKVSAVWSWHDPLPGIMYLVLAPVLFVKRY